MAKPITWQGWLTLIGCIAIMGGCGTAAIILAKSGNVPAATLLMGSFIVVPIAYMMIVARTTMMVDPEGLDEPSE